MNLEMKSIRRWIGRRTIVGLPPSPDEIYRMVWTTFPALSREEREAAAKRLTEEKPR